MKDGTIVDHVVSDELGLATSKQLPLGNYYIIETKAPDGYLLNQERLKVSLKYVDQTTSVVSASSTMINLEATVDSFQKKIDSQITDGHLGDVFLSQIEYGLYARETIQNTAKTVTYYAKDQLVSQKVTDDKGVIKWDQLPLGHYYLKELKTNQSLVLNPEEIDVDVLYAGMNTPQVHVLASGVNKIAESTYSNL